MLREVLKGARTNWNGPLAHCSSHTTQEHVEAVRRTDPQLADFINQQLESARDRMARPKGSGSPGAKATILSA
jgi:hypothetical protein